MNKLKASSFKKRALSTSIATVFSLGVAQNTLADIYKFTFDNADCVVSGTSDTCTDTAANLAGGYFTLLTSAGAPVANSAYPYYGDATWGYGFRTQIQGSITIDNTNGTGLGVITPFDFQGGNAATFDPADANGISMSSIGDGAGGAGTLWLSNMLFDWNGTIGIPVSIVWDMAGLSSGLSLLDVNNIGAAQNTLDAADCVGGALDGICVVSASNGITKGAYPLGPVPIATTTWNTTTIGGAGLTTNPSGEEPIIADTFGGSPMVAGPFTGFNATFDFTGLVLSGYNDTTAPVLSFSNSIVSIDLNSTFDGNNPGVTVTCADVADGTGTLTVAGGSTDNDLTFTVNASDLAAVNETVSGTYPVRYSCTDNASARTPISDDPNNPGSATSPSDNTSNAVTLNVIVADPNAPVISITSDAQPTVHEACTVYVDAGATVTDIQDDNATLTAAIVRVDVDSIIGTSPADSDPDATITYDVDDLGGNPVTAANPSGGILPAVTRTRTVTFVDTTGPVITIPGGGTVSLESSQAGSYSPPVATVVDANGNCNPVSGGTVTTTDAVNFIVPNGQDTLQSTLRYIKSDTASPANQTQENQVVTVSRSEPVITLIGGGVVISVGGTYTEQGMNIHDIQDGDLAAITATGGSSGMSYTVTSNVNTAVKGSYTVTYNVTDSDANTATQVTRNVSVGVFAEGSNFTMLTPSGQTFGGTNDVVFDWDQTFNTDETDTDFTKLTIVSALPQPFFSNFWTAHHIRVYNAGTYSFDTTCTTGQLEAGTSACNNAFGQGQTQRFLTMTVAAGQVGVHMLFNWGAPDAGTACGVANCDIDVVNVWDQNALWNDPDGAATVKNNLFMGDAGSPPDVTQPWKLVSTDLNGDGINGSPMLDGPFIGYYANFNAGPGGVGAIPVITITAPDTALGSGSMSWGELFALFLSLVSFGLYRRVGTKDN